MPVPDGPGQRWSLDFLSDVFGAGRRFRILSVIDDHTRERLALVADTSIPGQRVAREPDAVVRLFSKPLSIVSDNVLCRHMGEMLGREISSRRSIPGRLAA